MNNKHNNNIDISDRDINTIENDKNNITINSIIKNIHNNINIITIDNTDTIYV